jgi:hypothetical protein
MAMMLTTDEHRWLYQLFYSFWKVFWGIFYAFLMEIVLAMGNCTPNHAWEGITDCNLSKLLAFYALLDPCDTALASNCLHCLCLSWPVVAFCLLLDLVIGLYCHKINALLVEELTTLSNTAYSRHSLLTVTANFCVRLLFNDRRR